MRWDDCQRLRKPQDERVRKESQGHEEEVSLRELKEQLECPKKAGDCIMQIAKQATNERGKKLFQIFRQEENEVYTNVWRGGIHN